MGAVAARMVQPGSLILLIFSVLLILNHFGRPFEKVLVGFKIPAVICATAAVVMLLGGGMKILSHRLVLTLLAFLAWQVVTIPFSTWKGGSFFYVRTYALFWPVLMIVVGAGIANFKQVRALIVVLIGACLLHIVFGSFEVGGRLALEGTYGNSDDVALLAGFIIPFAILMGSGSANILMKLVFGGVGLYLLSILGRTGTRAGFLALGVVVAMYFWRATMKQRIGLIAATVVVAMMSVLVVPASTLDRLLTIFDAFDTSKINSQIQHDEAYASMADRKDLMWDAVLMTVQNPLFGVGPGEFMDYRFQNFKYGSGQNKRFMVSHCTYLQISSEMGLPGLILYIGFISALVITTRRARRWNQPGAHPYWQEGMRLTQALEGSVLFFIVCALLMTCDQHPHQFVLAGFAIAIERISEYLYRQHQLDKSVQGGIAQEAGPTTAPQQVNSTVRYQLGGRPRLTPNLGRS